MSLLSLIVRKVTFLRKNTLPTEPRHLGLDTLPIKLDWDKILDNRKHVLANYHDVPDYLLLPEVTTLLHHFKDNTKHLFFNTLWNTGVRLSEALSLTPEPFINESYIK